jgi:catechol 2,3-dioxygenase-like lactoylglutathione lyase family enzyme
MKIKGFDHFVLTVRDLDATCEFYTRVLGMQAVTFGGGRRALQFGRQKINLHEAGKEFEPKALKPTPGSGDFCLITDVPIAQVIEYMQSRAVAIVAGPVSKTGALGPMLSIYVRDPDGNLVEVSNYA